MDTEMTCYASFAEVTEDFYCSAVDVLKILVLRLHDYHACKRLAALLPDTVSVTRIQPCMKDWNDVLVHRAEIPNRNYFKSIVLKEPRRKIP